ncbi:MAG TPA: hypothetical protein VF107_02190 [Burkholderiaceae bacterium]
MDAAPVSTTPKTWVENPEMLQRNLAELQRQADAAARLGNRSAAIGYAAIFIAIPFVVVLFRLHLQSWHYYVAGGLFLLGALVTHALELAAMTRRERAIQAIEHTQAACAAAHERVAMN